MKLSYCQTEHGNFGDDLNLWLWPRLLPGFLDDDPRAEFVGIGTLLSRRQRPGLPRVVFGAGTGYKAPPKIDGFWKIYSLRGPLTAQALGVDPSLAVTDSAILLRLFREPTQAKRFDVSYMPHHRSLDLADWPRICQLAGVHFVDPRRDVDTVLRETEQSELLLAEAMHGAIAADTLRVPWVPVRAYAHILPFKWHDWTASIETTWEPRDLPLAWQAPLRPSRRLRNLVRRGIRRLGYGPERWDFNPVRTHGPQRCEAVAERLAEIARTATGRLSTDAVFERRLAQTVDCLDRLRNDFGIALRTAA